MIIIMTYTFYFLTKPCILIIFNSSRNITEGGEVTEEVPRNLLVEKAERNRLIHPGIFVNQSLPFLTPRRIE